MKRKFAMPELGELGRRALIGWIFACTLEYLLSSCRSLADTAILSQVSVLRLAVITVSATVLLQWLSLKAELERWSLVGIFAILTAVCLIFDFAWGFFAACLVVLAILTVNALVGRSNDRPLPSAEKEKKLWYLPLLIIAAAFFAFVSAWTVCRFLSFANSTYDFGIFAQMFHNMAESGAPMTTLERSRELSHFHVYMSPIYYLMLPFYWLFPSPVTLQILQAAILASAVLPLYKLARLHALSGLQGLLLCAVLLVFPAFSGGTSYDLHENCFLTPLILWMLYAADRKNRKLTALFALLTLAVKEDAAIYVVAFCLWLFFRRKEDRAFALGLALVALAWFFAVTSYLANYGDGVMSNRYNNLMPVGSQSLLSVLVAALSCPMKLLYEAFEPQKLTFFCQTMLPLAFMPLLTRKFERFLLIVPFFVVNLLSDYPYQHSIFFQYTYGSTAFLLYLTVVNLADIPKKALRIAPLGVALVLGLCIFSTTVKPVAQGVNENYLANSTHYADVRKALDEIPDGASVAATAFYTPHLSEREVLYDVLHCTAEQILSSEYVVLQIHAQNEYANFNSTPLIHDGYENLVFLLERNGYALHHELDDVLTIYKR